jgi:hypothetical protein
VTSTSTRSEAWYSYQGIATNGENGPTTIIDGYVEN